MAKRLFLIAVNIALLITAAGCTHKEAGVIQPVPVSIAVPTFPPQKVMENGDYASFVLENQKALKACTTENDCETALFNLGFAYGYPKSPYYNQSKANRYFGELLKKYPGSPLAFQAKAWMDVMKKSVASEQVRRRLKTELKAKDTELKSKDTEIKTKDTEIKTKEETITELQEQLKRSRDIDAEIEQRERELLQ